MHKYMLLLLIVLSSCKVKKDIQLQESKSNFNVKSDSSYVVQFDDSLTAYRTYLVDFDSSGKLSNVRIEEVVKQAKKSISKGVVKKDVEQSTHDKTTTKKIERERGTIHWSLIVFASVVVGLMLVKKVISS